MEQFQAITREIYFLSRGHLPQDIPLEYILGYEHQPFLAELSMTEKYIPNPTTVNSYFRGRMGDADRAAYQEAVNTHFGGRDDFGSLLLLLRDTSPHILNSYALMLFLEPSPNLAYALHDLHLWFAYGQCDYAEEKGRFDGILEWEKHEQIDFSVPKNRGTLWGLCGDEPAILQATDIGAWE